MVEFETNQILDNLPMVALIIVIIITYTPQVPSFIKLPILIVGIVGSIVVSFATEKVLQYEASSYIALKCNIYPLNKTVTFFIGEQLGEVRSICIDKSRQMYRTGPLKLATKVPFQIFGKVESIIIEHSLPWDKRMKSFPGTVVYKGVQIKHKSVALMSLFLDENKGVEVNMLNVIPVFKMACAPQDYWILGGEPYQDIGDL
jgi:hypothetical protein